MHQFQGMAEQAAMINQRYFAASSTAALVWLVLGMVAVYFLGGVAGGACAVLWFCNWASIKDTQRREFAALATRYAIA